MRTTSPPENEENYDEDNYSEKLSNDYIQQCKLWFDEKIAGNTAGLKIREIMAIFTLNE